MCIEIHTNFTLMEMKKNKNSAATLALVLGLSIGALTSSAAYMIVLEDGTEAASSRTAIEKPLRIRQEERDAMKQEHQEAERLGNEMDRLQESFAESGEGTVPIEVLRDLATEKLKMGGERPSMEGSQVDHGDGEYEEGHQTSDEHQLRCFGTDGAVTDVRDQCDPDQGKYFGMTHDARNEDISDSMETRFAQSERGEQGEGDGPPLLTIISNAIGHLSQILEETRGQDADKEADVKEVIAWLGTILGRYASAEPSPEERTALAQEVRSKIESVVGHFEGRQGGGMQGPDCSMIITRMKGMIIEKLPQVIAIFDEAGLPVSDDARAALEEARQKFEAVTVSIAENPSSCMDLRSIFEILETRMRPSMEKTIMESGDAQVMKRVMELVGEEGHEMPSSMNGQGNFDRKNFDTKGAHRGFPQEMDGSRHFGAPSDFESDMRMPDERNDQFVPSQGKYDGSMNSSGFSPYEELERLIRESDGESIPLKPEWFTLPPNMTWEDFVRMKRNEGMQHDQE